MRALLFAAAVAFSPPALAQDNAVYIPFSPGARTVFDIEETRDRVSVGEIRGPTGASRTLATLEITGTAAPYRAVWTTTRVEARGQTITASTPGAAQLLIGEPVVLTLDEDGSPIAIERWEELQRGVMQAIIDLTPEAERTAEWQNSMDATRRMFSSMDPAQAARLLFQHVGIMALCQNTGLEPGQQLRSEVMTPNPLGGTAIRTLAAYELTSVDRNAGVANILFTSSFDPDSTRASIREMIERIGRETGRPMPAEEVAQLETMQLDQSTRAECVVDLQSGIVRSIEYSVSLEAGAHGSRTDRRSIRVTRR